MFAASTIRFLRSLPVVIKFGPSSVRQRGLRVYPRCCICPKQQSTPAYQSASRFLFLMGTEIIHLTAVVLVGGKSNRMGSPKHLLRYVDGRTLYEHTMSTIRSNSIVNRITVALRCEADCDLIPAIQGEQHIDHVYDENLHLFTSQLPEDLGGPSAGILAAHVLYPTSHLLVVACDFPLLELETIQQLIDNYHEPITCFKNQAGFTEPLLSIWSPSGLKALLENVCDGKSGPSYTIRCIDGYTLRPNNEDWLYNANTPREWDHALRMIKLRGGALGGHAMDSRNIHF